MAALKGFKIGLDANLLLAHATRYEPAHSLIECNASLDMSLQRNLSEILTSLRKEFKLDIVVVMSGLRMPQQPNETAGLLNSYKLWSALKEKASDKQLFCELVDRFGVHFYSQEIANAAREAHCEFFVAPYLASAQLVYFFEKELISVAFGSGAMLVHESMAQAIVDFDLESHKFTFIDREELAQSDEDLTQLLL